MTEKEREKIRLKAMEAYQNGTATPRQLRTAQAMQLRELYDKFHNPEEFQDFTTTTEVKPVINKINHD